MPQFSRNYTSTEHSIQITWEEELTHINVYHGNKLIQSFEDTKEFRGGIEFHEENIGTISLKLTPMPPYGFIVMVNGTRLFSEEGKPKEEPFQRISGVFLFLFIMSIIGFGFVLVETKFNFSNRIYLASYGIEALITATYAVCASAIKKSKVWGFYVGISLYSLTTSIYFFNVFLIGQSFGIFTALIMGTRIAILLFIISFFKKAQKVQRDHKIQSSNNDLLDNTIE